MPTQAEFSAMSIAQLRAWAAEHGVPLAPDAKKKAEIVAALLEHAVHEAAEALVQAAAGAGTSASYSRLDDREDVDDWEMADSSSPSGHAYGGASVGAQTGASQASAFSSACAGSVAARQSAGPSSSIAAPPAASAPAASPAPAAAVHAAPVEISAVLAGRGTLTKLAQLQANARVAAAEAELARALADQRREMEEAQARADLERRLQDTEASRVALAREKAALEARVAELAAAAAASAAALEAQVAEQSAALAAAEARAEELAREQSAASISAALEVARAEAEALMARMAETEAAAATVAPSPVAGPSDGGPQPPKRPREAAQQTITEEAKRARRERSAGSEESEKDREDDGLRVSPGPRTPVADAVKRAPGLYKEQVVLDKEVHIVGSREAVLECDEDVTLHCKGPTAPSVRGITIRNAAPNLKHSTVLITDGSRAVLEGCDMSSSSLDAHAIEVRDEGTAPVLRSNVVHDCGGAAASIFFHTSACIFFHTSAKGTAEFNDVGNAFMGILIGNVADPIVRHNKVHDCKGDGIVVEEKGCGTIEFNEVFANERAGIAIDSEANPVVRQNMVHGNKEEGIIVLENGRGTIELNDVFGNSRSGIWIQAGADLVVRQNKVHDGKGEGIVIGRKTYPDPWIPSKKDVGSSGRSTLEFNDVYRNAYANIFIGMNADPIVRYNTVYDGEKVGISVYEGKGMIEFNEVFGNLQGIGFYGEADPLVRQNKVHDNKADGICVEDTGKGTLEENEVWGNGGNAIVVKKGASPVQRKNILHKKTGSMPSGSRQSNR